MLKDSITSDDVVAIPDRIGVEVLSLIGGAPLFMHRLVRYNIHERVMSADFFNQRQ